MDSLGIAFAGTFAASLEPRVRAHLTLPCDVRVADEAEIVQLLPHVEALAERKIAAAALDVWYRYPSAPGPTLPARRPFHELPNVLMTPHVSGWTDGMMEARAKVIAENVERIARGELPMNLIPPAHAG